MTDEQDIKNRYATGERDFSDVELEDFDLSKWFLKTLASKSVRSPKEISG